MDDSFREIYREANENIKRALQTPLTVVVCGPGRPQKPNPDDPFHLREAVRQSLKSDHVLYFEELAASEEGQETQRLLEQNLRQSPRVDQIEILLLKGTKIDKDVHIVEGTGSIIELTQFVADSDIFKKLYAFVDERHKNDDSYIKNAILGRLIKDDRLFWFKDESDLRSKVIEALNANRIAKSGLIPP